MFKKERRSVATTYPSTDPSVPTIPLEKLDLQPIFGNKGFLNTATLFSHISFMAAEFSNCQRPFDLQSLKSLLSGPLPKTFANSWLKGHEIGNWHDIVSNFWLLLELWNCHRWGKIIVNATDVTAFFNHSCYANGVLYWSRSILLPTLIWESAVLDPPQEGWSKAV